MKAFIMAVLLFVPFTVAAHSPVEFLDLIDDTKKSVVHVLNTPNDGELPTIANPRKDGRRQQDEDDDDDITGPQFFSGTGFIIEGGYIVTNHHVIDNSKKLEVQFENDPKSYPVTLVGADAAIDIAVLKPDHTFPKNIKPLKWRTERVRVGTEIWAIGHPGGLVYSVSKGIVSHIDRRIASPWQPTIQIDAAVNQGNSGGPLLDMDGYLVGVNVMIVSRVSEFNGIALAIDGFTAKKAVDILIVEGEIIRPLMGVALGYDSDSFRVKAEAITEGGAADLAGMEADDLYVSIEGTEIININDVFDVLKDYRPNDTIKVKVLRGRNTFILDVKLGKIPTQ